MRREELIQVVIAAIRETQRQSGRDSNGAITETTVPIRELAEFDSLNGLEATVTLEQRVGRSLPDNLFTQNAAGRPPSVGEVADRLRNLKPEEDT